MLKAPFSSTLRVGLGIPFAFIEALKCKLSHVINDRLVRNMGWYGLAELTSRVSRLITTIVLARVLTPADLGSAAIAITCFELIRVLTNNGIGQMVIRCRDDDLSATCNTAYRASRLACVYICLFQIVVGAILGWVCGSSDIAAMIGSLALVYIIMVPGLLPVYLIMRKNRTRELAFVSTTQVCADNFLSAVLAIAGFGAWSIVLPKLLTAPIWLFGVRHHQPWKRCEHSGEVPFKDLIKFSTPIIASEVLGAVRLNVDKILVWGILGVDALGMYYFAFNAGVGLSMAFTSALSNSLYPDLARLVNDPEKLISRFDRVVLTVVVPIAVLILLQASLAPIYVPVVFGMKWASAAGLVSILCFAAITKPFSDSALLLLRATGKSDIELRFMLIFTTVTLAALGVGLTQGLSIGVLSFSTASFVAQGALGIKARKIVNSLRPS
jgi:O-antigen/teichoic acid export membrane protein